MADETTNQSSSQGSGQTQSQGTSQQGTSSEGSSQTSSSSQTSQSQAPTRPEYVPEKFWDAAAGKISDEKALTGFINEHLAFKAAEDSKRLTLPQTADAYKTELPSDFVVPQGIEYKFNEADPLLAQAKTLAHQLGIPQEGFSKLLSLYAGAQVATEQQITAARNAEIAKLGPTGPSRVDAAATFFKAHLGEAEGKQLMSRMVTASDIAIAEKLMAKFASQGGGSFSSSRREADTGAKLTPEQYDKLSYSERKEYAAKHSGSTH